MPAFVRCACAVHTDRDPAHAGDGRPGADGRRAEAGPAAAPAGAARPARRRARAVRRGAARVRRGMSEATSRKHTVAIRYSNGSNHARASQLDGQHHEVRRVHAALAAAAVHRTQLHSAIDAGRSSQESQQSRGRGPAEADLHGPHAHLARRDAAGAEVGPGAVVVARERHAHAVDQNIHLAKMKSRTRTHARTLSQHEISAASRRSPKCRRLSAQCPSYAAATNNVVRQRDKQRTTTNSAPDGRQSPV